jgi:hypothetical protein
MPGTTVVEGQFSGGGSTRRVVIVEESQAGFQGDGGPVLDAPQVTVVGTAELDDQDRFSVAFEPAEPPPDATDWNHAVRVDVFEGPELVWSSGPRPIAALVDVSELATSGTADVLPAAPASCTVHGTLTACGHPRAGLTAVVTERAFIGVDQPGEPCVGHERRREAGRSETDTSGRYRVQFTPMADNAHCAFPHRIQVTVFDGATEVFSSPSRLMSSDVTVNGELFPDCPAGASVVRVRNEAGESVGGAQVYVDGRLAGRTGVAGELHIFPPLVAGQLLAALTMVHEFRTSRPNHVVSGTTSWAYRVYLTSLRLRSDANGDGARLPLVEVEDPEQPIELVVRRRNTLVGLNLTASIEWNASTIERQRIRDRMVDTSELLYNATDGQFLIEHIRLVERGSGWDDVDVRIFANLNQRSEATAGGFFGSSGRVNLNPNDAYYAGTLLHELGHYAFAIRDEYQGEDWDPANGPVRCTLQSTDTGTPFSNGGEKDSCFMRGAQYEPKKKLCSSHPDNPHVAGTDQGNQDCWSDLLGSYGHAFRWLLQTPAARGVIIDRLRDSGTPLPTTTSPPSGGDQVVQSYIPVRAWQPQFRSVIDNRGELVENLVVRTVFNGTRVPRQAISVQAPASSRRLLQGRTKAAPGYSLAYGLSTGNCEIPLRGAHVGDTVRAVGPNPSGGILVGSRVVESATPQTLVVAMTRFSFPPLPALSPNGDGALRIQTREVPGVRSAIHARSEGPTAAMSMFTRVGPDDQGFALVALPRGGGPVVVSLTGTTLEGDSLTLERRIVTRMVEDDEPVMLRSADAGCRLQIGPGTFDRPRQVLIAEPAPDAPAEIEAGQVVAGPYDVLVEPDEPWSRAATLTFRLPSAELPSTDAPDSDVAGWMARLRVVEQLPGAQQWQVLPSTYGVEPAFVTTRLDHSGTFALVLTG